MNKNICGNCKEKKTKIYEMLGYKNCSKCWREYYKEEELYDDYSFDIFLNGMRLIK